MKYIRTKDKIEKVPNDYAKKLVECPNLRIADTIEELCDGFVINVEEKGYLIADNFKTFVEYSKQGIKEQVDIKCFGAIWTSKGLIYVAKMNDKGELELL